MKLHVNFLRLIAQFLLAAILLQALVPAWAGVKSSAGKPLLEICTAVGTQWIKQGAQAGDQPSIDHSSSSTHCVFCASTAAVDTFDASKLLVNHTSSDVLTESAMPLVGVFSGHSIRSRAPPL
jgi:hypothetical protein